MMMINIAHIFLSTTSSIVDLAILVAHMSMGSIIMQPMYKGIFYSVGKFGISLARKNQKEDYFSSQSDFPVFNHISPSLS